MYPHAPRNRTNIRDTRIESRKIIELAGITDYVNDARNLSLALNHDHTLEYAEAVLRRLKKAQLNANGDPAKIAEEFAKALNEIREILLDGKIYRYPE